MLACREVDGKVDWADVRKRMDRALDEAGLQIELDQSETDPETWGLSPAAVEAQHRALGMGGQVGS